MITDIHTLITNKIQNEIYLTGMSLFCKLLLFSYMFTRLTATLSENVKTPTFEKEILNPSTSTYSRANIKIDNNTLIDDSSVIQPIIDGTTYPQNSIIFWHIIPDEQTKNSIVAMTIEKLQIDDVAGDYLLIGATVHNYVNSSVVFDGPPPLFLTGSSTESKDVIVFSERVYVVLISKGKKRSPSIGFKIKYKRIGKKIISEPTEFPYLELLEEAVPICVSTKLNFTTEVDLKNNISSILANTVEFEDKSLSISNIVFLRYVERSDGNFYLLLAVSDIKNEKKPAFKYKELTQITNRLIRERIVYNEYTIIDCEKQYDEDDSIYIAYSIIPISLILFLFVWWWTYNNYWNSIANKKEEIFPHLKIEMFPAQVMNPIYQPDTPLSDECNKSQPSFVFTNEDINSNYSAEQDDTIHQPDTPSSNERIIPHITLSLPDDNSNKSPGSKDAISDEASNFSCSPPLTPCIKSGWNRKLQQQCKVSFAFPPEKEENSSTFDELDEEFSVDKQKFTKL